MASLVAGTALLPSQRKRNGVLNKSIPIERRSRVRYPIEAPVTFRSLDKSQIAGEGRVENMSSVGLFVVSRLPPSVGTTLELRMRWPTLLEERIPLQFIAIGKVVRCGLSSFAVLFHAHKFRTAGVLGAPGTRFAEA